YRLDGRVQLQLARDQVARTKVGAGTDVFQIGLTPVLHLDLPGVRGDRRGVDRELRGPTDIHPLIGKVEAEGVAGREDAGVGGIAVGDRENRGITARERENLRRDVHHG